MTFGSWIMLLTCADTGNFCGLWVETFFFFSFSFSGIACIWLMSRSHIKEGVGELKLTEIIHENCMMGTKLTDPHRDQ